MSSTPDLSQQLLLPIQPWDHTHGPEDAAFTLVEYGDYECPACGRLYVMLRDLQAEHASRLRIAFRHYPYSGIHKHAQKAAEAAEAAGEQGKFWQMHTLLFENQSALGDKDLLRYAAQLELDTARFRRDLKDGAYSARVRENFRAGVQNGVFSTPGLFLNGVRQAFSPDEGWLRGILSQASAANGG